MKRATRLALVTLALLPAGCTYLRFAALQESYRITYATAPTQQVAKHLLDRGTWFVYGRLVDEVGAHDEMPLAVVALSSRHHPDEIVEVNHLGKASTYYALNLPEGDYRLLVLADADGDGQYGQDEIVAERMFTVSRKTHPGRVAGGIDLSLTSPRRRMVATLPLRVATGSSTSRRESLVFPKGTLRSLDDPVFSETMGALGMYEPAAFIESAPMMFYALDEEAEYKIPVVFVHGIGGSARQFAPIVDHLDRKRFKPWFFYYPSGADLSQVALLFYEIFLSGRTIPQEGMPMVIVAHSMGGLVTREALNHWAGTRGEANVALFVTLATPFGGHPAAKDGVERAPVVLPAWRDLNPEGGFLRDLFRNPLPASVAHHLIYAYRDETDLLGDDGGDGTVPLASQLAIPAVAAATRVHGLRATHDGILTDPWTAHEVTDLAKLLRNIFPDDHLAQFDLGGFPVALGPEYSPIEKFFLESYGGFYLRALANGKLKPFHPVQKHFIDVVNGRAEPGNPAETAWLRFRAQYPDLASDEGRAIDERKPVDAR